MNVVRRRAGAAGALAAALALGACGGGDPEVGAPAATDVPPTVATPGTVVDDDRTPTPNTEAGTVTSAGSGEGRLLGPADTRSGDGVVFVTGAPTTHPTTTRPTPSSSTPTTTTSSTTTTTSSTTTSTSSSTSTTTTSTVPAPTSMRCSFAADALFDPGEAELHEHAAGELARLAATVGDDVRLVRVEGRTDHRGTDADNELLSERRAAAAAAALVDAGIDANVVEIVAIGEAEARQPGPDHEPTEDEMAEDRRVDVVVEADVAITTRCDAPSGG